MMMMKKKHTLHHNSITRHHVLCRTAVWTTLLLLFISCARMGQPDGGWYDEQPPRVVGATPADKATNVNAQKIIINFDEFVKIDNPTEKVVVSPPQLEMPEIKGAGKRVVVELKDTLKPNTTYTVDFSDAISDNNEGNPLGNYTYSFSTGEQIDTMEVSGYVLEAENLEPIKGILVGLYDDLSDTAFTTKPFMRVSRTDSRGRFVVKGIAHGSYRAYALQDADANYMFSQKSEKIAFNHEVFQPGSFPDTRPDTIWRDSLHIETIRRLPYTHFTPDDIVLRAFTEVPTDRFFLKSDRTEPQKFTLFFSAGSDSLPKLTGLNFNADTTLVVETSERRDTITYWLRDSMLINQDTLRMAIQFMGTDTAGVLVQQYDTLEILSKEPYAKRMKQKEKEYEEWKKKAEKAEKKGEPVEPLKDESLEPLRVSIGIPTDMTPLSVIRFTSVTPLVKADTTAIHLYTKRDSVWYIAPFQFHELPDVARTYELTADWQPETEYSLELDSAAFVDIYGKATAKNKNGIKVKGDSEFSSVFITLTGMDTTTVVIQLVNKDDKVVRQLTATNGEAKFYYVRPETYYLRAFEDHNGNQRWDTGKYDADLQPEAVYYFNEPLECKAKWDVSRSWNPKSVNAAKQKPAALVKQKADKEKTIKRQNYQRAKKLGIDLPDELKKLDEQIQSK